MSGEKNLTGQVITSWEENKKEPHQPRDRNWPQFPLHQRCRPSTQPQSLTDDHAHSDRHDCYIFYHNFCPSKYPISRVIVTSFELTPMRSILILSELKIFRLPHIISTGTCSALRMSVLAMRSSMRPVKMCFRLKVRP